MWFKNSYCLIYASRSKNREFILHRSFRIFQSFCSSSTNSIPVVAYEQATRASSRLEAENQGLRTGVSRLQDQNKMLLRDIGELRVTCDTQKESQVMLRNELEGLKSSVTDLTSSNTDLNTERSIFKKKYKKIKRALDGLQSMADINDELIHTNSFLKNELTKLVSWFVRVPWVALPLSLERVSVHFIAAI